MRRGRLRNEQNAALLFKEREEFDTTQASLASPSWRTDRSRESISHRANLCSDQAHQGRTSQRNSASSARMLRKGDPGKRHPAAVPAPSTAPVQAFTHYFCEGCARRGKYAPQRP